MHVTLRQLHVFQAVAQNLSFTRAAEELHLSQPAVSMQVRQLEDSIGLALFEKTGRQISLTEAGHELYHYSQNICRELDEAAEVMESMKGVNRGHLKIAVASTINYFAPRLLAAFSKIYPGIELSLLVTNRENLVHLLKENEEDLVLMGLPPEEMDLESEPFMENPMYVVAAPDHPLVNEKNISMKRLSEETFLIREQGSGTRIAIERIFDAEGLTLIKGMQMTRNEAIKQAVRVGMGVSILSIHTIELELETGRLAILDVEGFPMLRHWHLVHRKGKRLSPAARAFRDFVMENATSI